MDEIMTETPPPKITGYRELSEAEVALINRVKAKAEEVGVLLAEIEKVPIAWILTSGVLGPTQPNPAIDPHWLAIGRTDLQKGFMAVIRAIARPEGF
jgi:hypothetical protein